MADRSSHRHSNASDSDSQHTFHIAQNAPSTLPKPPAPAVVRNSQGELNEKHEAGSDHDLEKQTNVSPRRSREMAERYNPYFARSPYQSSMSSDEDNDLVDQRLHLESKAIKILVCPSVCFNTISPCLRYVIALPIWSLCLTLRSTVYLVAGRHPFYRPHLPSTILLCFAPITVRRTSLPSCPFKSSSTPSNLLVQHHPRKECLKPATGSCSVAFRCHGRLAQRLGCRYLLGLRRHDW